MRDVSAHAGAAAAAVYDEHVLRARPMVAVQEQQAQEHLRAPTTAPAFSCFGSAALLQQGPTADALTTAVTTASSRCRLLSDTCASVQLHTEQGTLRLGARWHSQKKRVSECRKGSRHKCPRPSNKVRMPSPETSAAAASLRINVQVDKCRPRLIVWGLLANHLPTMPRDAHVSWSGKPPLTGLVRSTCTTEEHDSEEHAGRMICSKVDPALCTQTET